jgi:lipopolysaccharide biosynthesis regulator YciM
MPELLLLLLPIAALSGWVLGRRERRGDGEQGNRRQLPADYFQGLNYVLNEQPDRAIEAFTRIVEVDTDTVETHLALGNLFRRRGEVDRAIRIHQNLMARPALDRDMRAHALLELGCDYMRGGLLDRAENLFMEVVELDQHAETALKCLLEIYQQEKEWESAIDVAERLADRTGTSYARELAHFCCEQADRAWRAEEAPDVIRHYYKRALSYDRECVRAYIGLGDLAFTSGQLQAAKRSYKRVARQAIDYLPEVLDRLAGCYHDEDRHAAFQRYLEAVLDDYGGAVVAIKLAELIAERDGPEAAVDFLGLQLRERPSLAGVNKLIQLSLDVSDAAARCPRDLGVVGDLTAALEGHSAPYRCVGCGFEAHHLYWQCPTCRRWGTLKPVREAPVES